MLAGVPGIVVRNLAHMTACRVFGHRYRFETDGRTLRWFCARGCDVGGTKRYDTAEQASKYAAAFDRQDSEDLGRRAPLVGLLPLRIARFLRRMR